MQEKLKKYFPIVNSATPTKTVSAIPKSVAPTIAFKASSKKRQQIIFRENARDVRDFFPHCQPCHAHWNYTHPRRPHFSCVWGVAPSNFLTSNLSPSQQTVLKSQKTSPSAKSKLISSHSTMPEQKASILCSVDISTAQPVDDAQELSTKVSS